MKKLSSIFAFPLSLFFLLISLSGISQQPQTYQSPPKAIQDLIDIPQTPRVYLSPQKSWMALVEMPSMPSIEEVSQPELRIGGLRINPRTNGPSRDFSYGVGMKLINLESQEEFLVSGLPSDAHMGNFTWSPNGKYLAFTQTDAQGIYAWMLDLSNRRASQLMEVPLNGAIRGTPLKWSADSEYLICRTIPDTRGEAPQAPAVPSGPVVSENAGKAAPNRTYQDLLKSPADEALFQYYTHSQLMQVSLTGETTPFGDAGMVAYMDPSPNGAYWMVERIEKPFSYLVPYYRFAQEVEIWDNTGKRVQSLASIPVAEDIPKGFGAVRKGPRSHEWRPDKPATVFWVEAQDQGDPRRDEEIRDRMYYLDAPFVRGKSPGVEFELRYSGMDWVKEDLAFSYEYWFKTRQRIVNEFSPKDPEYLTDVVFKRSTEDRYNDPGRFVDKRLPSGHSSLLMDANENHLYLIGQGASPEGSKPFIDQYNISDGKTQRLWQSESPFYEYPIAIIDPDQGSFVTRRESSEEPPNYFLRNWKNEELKQLTQFPNPYPSLASVEKQELSYLREDSLQLTGTLYTPPGYKLEEGPLPTFIWAYPREFKSASHAGQRTDSPHRFPRLSWGSPIFWVMRGYAVLNNASMPVVGEGKAEPNDTFIDQLVMNAEAAIDKLVEMGIGDRNRMALGGHSYGAFMTANLLAHSDLFAAGIARSGAYNRSLTPFGFQREERTFWESPEIYFQMSPFMHAEKVNEPILLIHGQADNNSGTFPMQSERFYNALKGHGATTRLVMLPYESHGYRARESILHMLWEMDQWLERYVNQKQ
ncbi:MAG: prolyl oligopeptidase family serine peptidase [Bacteroidota bacterium]